MNYELFILYEKIEIKTNAKQSSTFPHATDPISQYDVK